MLIILSKKKYNEAIPFAEEQTHFYTQENLYFFSSPIHPKNNAVNKYSLPLNVICEFFKMVAYLTTEIVCYLYAIFVDICEIFQKLCIICFDIFDKDHYLSYNCSVMILTALSMHTLWVAHYSLQVGNSMLISLTVIAISMQRITITTSPSRKKFSRLIKKK